jgi:hypothetical protein
LLIANRARGGDSGQSAGQASAFEIPPALEPRHAAILELIQDAFVREPRIEDWSDDREEELMTFFVDDVRASGSLLAEVDCRTSMCRLRIEHEDRRAKHDLISAIGKPPLHVAGIRFPGGDRLRSSVVYLAREGHRLSHRRPPSVSTGPSDDHVDASSEEGFTP